MDKLLNFIDADTSKKDKHWTMSVVRGYFEKVLSFKVEKNGETTIRIYLQDTGLALSQIDINQEID